ncbi:hypothetical protein ABR33_06050 [Enterobacter bugandensis]|nr:hypothetical protein ABR33_06050 [Enterobacter bugandensis]
MKETMKGQEASVTDLSRMYVGPQQRATMKQQLYTVARRKGYSHNQATALAEQGVRDFVAKMDEQRRAAALGGENE